MTVVTVAGFLSLSSRWGGEAASALDFKQISCHDVNAKRYNEKEIDDLMTVEL